MRRNNCKRLKLSRSRRAEFCPCWLYSKFAPRSVCMERQFHAPHKAMISSHQRSIARSVGQARYKALQIRQDLPLQHIVAPSKILNGSTTRQQLIDSRSLTLDTDDRYYCVTHLHEGMLSYQPTSASATTFTELGIGHEIFASVVGEFGNSEDETYVETMTGHLIVVSALVTAAPIGNNQLLILSESRFLLLWLISGLRNLFNLG